MSGDDLLTAEQAARLLGVHVTNARGYARAGLLPARKYGVVWLFRRADVEAFRATLPRPVGRPKGRTTRRP